MTFFWSLLSTCLVMAEELWSLRLGLKLLMERAQTDSFWWPYISNLPQRLNVPIFFSGDDIAALQYAPVVFQVKKRCKVLLDLAKVVGDVLPKFPLAQQPFCGQQVDAGSLGWAMAAVSSRAFQMGPAEERVLLPLIDMCNHSFTPNAKIIQQDKRELAFVVVSEEDLHERTNILLSYGDLSNDQLLLDYGFVVPQNPWDYVELRYDRSLLDGAREMAKIQSGLFLQPLPWQRAILEMLELEGSNARLQIKAGGHQIVEGRLLAAIRILFADNAGMVANKELCELQAWDNVPLGNLIECNALKTLITMCALVLGHFPTTIDDDEVLIKEEKRSAKKLAIEFRMVKKQLLVNCIRALKTKLSLVAQVEAEFPKI